MNEVNETDASGVNVRIGRYDQKCMNRVITHDEVRKAVGIDNIPYAMYNEGRECMIKRLTALFNAVWENGCVPNVWNESRVIPLHNGRQHQV
jgi:hypothetical protein